tara:strand:+ start:614 stop:814 length:201 start_codon:yes stop_codon:yes gene_type:complete
VLKVPMKRLLKPLKPLLYAYLRSDTGKKTILSLLRSLAKQTNNTLDDQAVEFLEARLFPESTTKLQ